MNSIKGMQSQNHDESDTETEETQPLEDLEKPDTEMEEGRKIFIIFEFQKTIRYFQPNITLATTIFDLKKMIEIEWFIPIDYQVLRYGITKLQNEKTLDSYEFKWDEPSFHLTLECVTPPGDKPLELNQNTTDQIPETTATPVYGPAYMTNHRFSSNDDSDNDTWDKRPAHGYVGLKNQGATCYLNSLIQVLYLTPEFRKMIYRFPRPYEKLLSIKLDHKENSTNSVNTEEEVNPKKDIIFQMQLLFAKMQFANVSCVSTAGLTTSFGWDNSDIFVQHDVQELNRVLCDKLEEKMKGHLKEDDDSIASLYKGVMLNLIRCINCGRVSSREEDFYDVSLTIKGKKSIDDSFKEFTEVEKLEGENAYHCEQCNSKQTAEKSIKFRSLPKILNLQLKRFEYDWDRDIRVKLNDEISFPMNLDMTPYLVDSQTLKDQQNSNHNINTESEAANSEAVLGINASYELVGILVHSGSAGFGHYYAFIKSPTDSQWFKFNDENVTSFDEENISSQNWTGSYQQPWSNTSILYKSATPYMLVYRQRVPHIVANSNNLEEKTDSPAEANDMPTKKRLTEGSIKIGAVSDEEIPTPILNYLREESEKKQKIKDAKEKERNSCTVTIYRNRLDLPVKSIKMEKTSTLQNLLDATIEAVSQETDQNMYYRFRRVASRKNNTRRPMQILQPPDYQKSLIEYGLDNPKRGIIYLDQSTSEDFGGVGDFDNTQLFLSFRYWNSQLRRPMTIGDFNFPKSITVNELKQSLYEKELLPYKPEECVAVEEETEKTINLLDNSCSLGKLSIISGDIIHFEPISLENKGSSYLHLTENYYFEKSNDLTVEVEEIQKKKNVKPSDDNREENFKVNGESKAAPPDTKFKIMTNKSHTLAMLKEIIGIKLGIEPKKLRVYAKDPHGFNDLGKLLKNSEAKLGTLLEKGSSKINSNLAVEKLDEPEDLRKGDKLIKTRYHNSQNDLVHVFEIKINKTETIRDFKTRLREKTGVPEENQVISEWYSEHFYKFFPNDNETISSAHIRKTDVLRMDPIKDPSLNINITSNIALQVVQFIAWDVTTFGKKEMQTTFPALLTISENSTLFDLRKRVAELAQVPPFNVNIAFNNHFPIGENIQPIKEVAKTYNSQAQKIEFTEEEKEEEERMKELAIKENRDAKVWDFNLEKRLKLKDCQIRTLEIVCWEDIRKKPEKTASKQVTRNKKRDSESLKIH